jgi:hypothetical protein
MRKIYSLIVVIAALFSLMAVSGCGGGSNSAQGVNPNHDTPPPSTPTPTPTAFSNALLNGNYVVAVKGTTANGPFTLLAILQADGNGTIPMGHTFYNSSTISIGNFPISGTYNVAGDGRTTFNLNVPTLDAITLGTITLDAVLISPQHGMVVRFDSTATASGSIDKQAALPFSAAAMAGTYVFNFQGTDSAGQPETSVGTFTVDDKSNITGGIQDTNDNGVITAGAAVMAAPSSVFDVVPDVGNGVFSYTTSPEGLRDYALVAIDANHIKFASNESNKVQLGDLYRASPANFSGSLVFALHGVAGAGGPAFAAGGIINTNNAGGVLSSSVEDVNSGGAVSLNSPLSGTYSASGSRVLLALNGGAINLAAYPSMGGFQVIETDSSAIASGVALPQTGGFSNATLNGDYGATFAGSSASGEFVALARATADGNGHLTGMLNLNDNGSLQSDLALNGTYSMSSNGRAPGTLVTSAGSLNVIYYVASKNQGLFIEVDNRISQGVLARQQ